jgi:hypothetical protein
VRDESVRVGGAQLEEVRYGFRREFGNLAVKLVFEAATGIHKANFFSVFRFVEGLEVLKAELPALVFTPPDCGGGAVAKQAKADEHAGFVVEVKCR